MTGKPAALHALDIFEQFPSLGFEDALYLAHAELDGLEGIYSYDRGLDKVPGANRFEPAPL